MTTANSNGQPVSKMRVADAVNRGYNMLAGTLLLVIGIGFTEVIGGEPDLIDKVDNTILLIVGLVAVAWCLIGSNLTRRSPVPVALGIAGLLGQIFGIIVEFGDSQAIGDDFGGLTIYLAAVVALVVIYTVNRRVSA